MYTSMVYSSTQHVQAIYTCNAAGSMMRPFGLRRHVSDSYSSRFAAITLRSREMSLASVLRDSFSLSNMVLLFLQETFPWVCFFPRFDCLSQALGCNRAEDFEIDFSFPW